MFLSQKKSEKEYSMQNKNLVFTPSISFQELSQVSDDLFTKPLRFDLGIHPHESDHISHIFCKSEPSMWCLTKAYIRGELFTGDNLIGFDRLMFSSPKTAGKFVLRTLSS